MITLHQGHGRHETRACYPFAATPQTAGFPHAAQGALLVRTTHHLKSCRVTEELEILLTSRSPQRLSPSQLTAARRGHWGIESRLHYVRDVTFGEDASTVRTGHSPRNLAALRNLVIGLCGLSAAREHQPSSYLPAFRREAQLDADRAVALVARPLLS